VLFFELQENAHDSGGANPEVSADWSGKEMSGWRVHCHRISDAGWC